MTEIKIISWNVAGIRAGIRKGLWQKMRDMGADIYCFQETKARKDQVPMGVEYPQEYKDFWNPAEKAGYSGVATFSKLEPKKVIVGDKDNDWDDEGRVIITKFDEFSLLNVYFPNANAELTRLAYKLDFNRDLLAYINKLESNKPVIIAGDFNVAHQEIDLARPKENAGHAGFTTEERNWFKQLLSAGYLDSFRLLEPKKVQYSWWSFRAGARRKNVGWRIDYFVISAKLRKKIKKAFILDQVLGSDHAPVGIEI